MDSKWKVVWQSDHPTGILVGIKRGLLGSVHRHAYVASQAGGTGLGAGLGDGGGEFGDARGKPETPVAQEAVGASACTIEG